MISWEAAFLNCDDFDGNEDDDDCDNEDDAY